MPYMTLSILTLIRLTSGSLARLGGVASEATSASYTLGPDLHLDPRCFRTPDALGPDLH